MRCAVIVLAPGMEQVRLSSSWRNLNWGAIIPAAAPSSGSFMTDTLSLLKLRRSVPPQFLSAPGPDDAPRGSTDIEAPDRFRKPVAHGDEAGEQVAPRR